MTDPQSFEGRQRLERQLDAREERQGALGADQQMRRIERIAEHGVEIIAADPPQQFREVALDFG